MNFHHIFQVKQKKTYLHLEYSFNSLSCREPSFSTPFKTNFIKIGSVPLAGEFSKKHSTLGKGFSEFFEKFRLAYKKLRF